MRNEFNESHFSNLKFELKCGVLTIWPTEHLSGKQDSNLQPPASKAGKLPIVIFPELQYRRDLNPQPSERQSGALAIVLRYYLFLLRQESFVEVVSPDTSGEPTSSEETEFTVRRANQLLNTSM